LLALTLATALVLLIACINVAGLLLARGVARQRALAVCAALGASRWRLVRQLLTESLMLGVGGGVLGLAAASMVLRAVPALVPGDVARLDEVGIAPVTLAFTFGLSIAAGLLFGAAPALQWSRLDLARTLSEGNEQSTGGFRLLRSNRARATLAVAQVALALVLLTGAGLLLRSFVRLITVDRGYDPANVIAAVIPIPDVTFRPDMTPESMTDLLAAGRRFQESLVGEMDRLAGLSDVEAVGVASRLPLTSGGGSAAVFRVAGTAPPADPLDLPRARVTVVSPGYFDAMRLRLRSGRAFTRVDGAESPLVLVVNETLARELFGGEPAVGRRLLPVGAGPEPWEVIGVVADVRYTGLAITESQAEAYIPLHQLEHAGMLAGMSSFFTSVVAVRTAGDPVAVVPFLREAVAAASPNARIDDLMTMNARLSAAVAQPRFYAVCVGFFAALALFLAAFGLYALLSYTVSQRRREIGVRMALGAQRGAVVALVVRQGAGLVAAGTLLGLLVSAASVRLLDSFVFGVATDDPLTLVAAPLVLAGVALLACWLPGRRAARIDPMDALRVE
ncbi:MAG: FtsX-like permease family protein, partial [Acidobacteria bacterium]|nr:FtsX-like permease family protein [Acidobacteriota bacterium]